MISVSEASQIIKSTCPERQTEFIDLELAHKRILAQQILSSREQPPFNRVAMDGVAINFNGKVLDNYNIEGVQAAGSPQLELKNNKNCIEVMTGSILPKNCNCVIQYEKTEISGGVVTLDVESLSDFQNIHSKGADYKAKEVILEKDLIITSSISAIIASQGKRKVEVYKSPKIAIISTGSELVELDQEAKDYQIHMSNSYAIEHELKNHDINNTTRIHITDDKDSTHQKIEECLNQYDILILTGGVSKGKFDYVPETLAKLGVEKHFHKIKQKPGKPMWYGTFKNKQIFALPGNPVSSLVCLRRYVLPSLLSGSDATISGTPCVLADDITFKRAFTLFAPIKISINEKGEQVGTRIKTNGSGDFYSLGKSSGFLELPENLEVYKKGEVYTYYSWG